MTVKRINELATSLKKMGLAPTLASAVKMATDIVTKPVKQAEVLRDKNIQRQPLFPSSSFASPISANKSVQEEIHATVMHEQLGEIPVSDIQVKESLLSHIESQNQQISEEVSQSVKEELFAVKEEFDDFNEESVLNDITTNDEVLAKDFENLPLIPDDKVEFVENAAATLSATAVKIDDTKIEILEEIEDAELEQIQATDAEIVRQIHGIQNEVLYKEQMDRSTSLDLEDGELQIDENVLIGKVDAKKVKKDTLHNDPLEKGYDVKE